MSEKRNWDRIKEQNVSDTVRYRDVYEDQQLERSKIEKKQSPVSRTIFAVIVSLFVVFLVYLIWSVASYMSGSLYADDEQSSILSEYGSDKSYYIRIDTIDAMTGIHSQYQAIDENGEPYGELYDDYDDVPVPDWYKAASATAEGGNVNARLGLEGGFDYHFRPTFLKVLVSFVIGAAVFAILYQVLMRNLDAQNAMNDTSDINQYPNDQHIALPEEIQRKFDWFPDVGAHSNVQVSSMISHMALKNKGLNRIEVAKRAKTDILDEDGDILYYKGEILLDDDGNPITESAPMIDEKFMDDLFTASGTPKDKSIRKYYDATTIDYNKGNKDREKLKGFDTVADLINNDWVLPLYEPQRPAGAYVVDTAPVNTMCLAITRAGKGWFSPVHTVMCES